MEQEGHQQLDPQAVASAEEAGSLKQPRELLIREIAETLLLTLFIFWIVNTATGRFRIEGYSMFAT